MSKPKDKKMLRGEAVALMLKAMGYSDNTCAKCDHWMCCDASGGMSDKPARCTIGLFAVEVEHQGGGHCEYFSPKGLNQKVKK